MLVRLATLALLATPLLAGAGDGDECTLEAQAIKPQFVAKLPTGFKLVSSKKDSRQMTQVVKVPDGLEVTVTMGGCEHVTYVIAVRGPGVTTKTAGSELVALSRRLLPTLPLDPRGTVDTKLFLRALDEAHFASLPAQLPCGEATCTLSLEPDEAKPPKGKKPKPGAKDEPPADPPGVLKLSYDVAL